MWWTRREIGSCGSCPGPREGKIRLDSRPAALTGSAKPDQTAEMPLDEFDRWLDELSAGTERLPSLPTDFSRADIYQDHD